MKQRNIFQEILMIMTTMKDKENKYGYTRIDREIKEC